MFDGDDGFSSKIPNEIDARVNNLEILGKCNPSLGRRGTTSDVAVEVV